MYRDLKNVFVYVYIYIYEICVYGYLSIIYIYMVNYIYIFEYVYIHTCIDFLFLSLYRLDHEPYEAHVATSYLRHVSLYKELPNSPHHQYDLA